MKENVFTFKGGVAVTLRRVSPFFVDEIGLKAEREFIEEHGKPVCPTYEVESAGGDVFTYDHDDTTIAQAPFLEDEAVQEKWREYRALSVMLDARVTEETIRAYAVRGVIDDPPEEWIEDRAYWGLPVLDPRDAKFAWLGDCASGWMEMLDLAMAIQRLRDPVQEAAEIASRSFRGSMEVAGGDDAGQGSGEADQGE